MDQEISVHGGDFRIGLEDGRKYLFCVLVLSGSGGFAHDLLPLVHPFYNWGQADSREFSFPGERMAIEEEEQIALPWLQGN